MTAPTSIMPFPPPPAENHAPLPDITLATAALGSTPPSPPSPQVGSPHKEFVPVESPQIQPESTRLVEIRESEPLPAEVEGWLQKLNQEGDIKLQAPVTHDGEVLLADSEAQIVKEKIVLPLSQSGVQSGLTHQVTDSARWLAEWCLRIIKIMKDKVKYAPETVNQS